MTNEQINLVFKIVAKMADNDDTKPIVYLDILQETHIRHEKLEQILVYLGKEEFIKIRGRVFTETDVVYITHKGINKSLSFNKG